MPRIEDRETVIDRVVAWISSQKRAHPIRVCVDGLDGAGKAALADELAEKLVAQGRAVIRASLDGFHRPREQRGDSPRTYYDNAFDHSALQRVLLDPLGPGGDRRYKPSVFDFRANRSSQAPWEIAEDDAILIVDGVFLLRSELRRHWDVRLYLCVDREESLRRVFARDSTWTGSEEEVRARFLARYFPAQDIYVEEVGPENFVDWIVDTTDLWRPVVVRFPEGALISQQRGADIVEARRQSFRYAGDAYERARPGYPTEAVKWILDAARADVLDLGCGPGKLTSQIGKLGHRVTGLDPSEPMLGVLRKKSLVGVCGTAEDLPIKTQSLDDITAAQAFHWFDHERAIPEMHRVLRPGGRVGLLWNLRDESSDWVRALSDIIGSETAMAATLGLADRFEMVVDSKLGYLDLFGSIEHRIFTFQQELDAERLVALVESRRDRKSVV